MTICLIKEHYPRLLCDRFQVAYAIVVAISHLLFLLKTHFIIFQGNGILLMSKLNYTRST
jgi:hypothetical protein